MILIIKMTDGVVVLGDNLLLILIVDTVIRHALGVSQPTESVSEHCQPVNSGDR